MALLNPPAPTALEPHRATPLHSGHVSRVLIKPQTKDPG